MSIKLWLLAVLLPPLTSASLAAQTRYASAALGLHAGPSAASRVLTRLSAGAAVEVRDCEHAGGEWCLVVFAAQRGFVESRLLDAQNPSIDPAASARDLASRTPLTALAPRSSTASAASRGYHRGPRGGCYTISATGRKRYVERSLCD